MMFVMYHPSTGEIVGTSSVEPMMFPDIAFIEAELPDALLEKIDPQTKTIVRKSVAEVTAAKLPKDHEIASAIAAELSSTDQYMMPDRPITDAKRAVWATYRQALRDLSKLQDVAAMVAAFPAHPDGAPLPLCISKAS